MTPACGVCGYAVDWLRSCYASEWRLFRNSEQVTRGRYYFSSPDTPFYPGFHFYGSRVWVTDERDPLPALGDIGTGPPKYFKGKRPVQKAPTRQLGEADCISAGDLFPPAALLRRLVEGQDSRCWNPGELAEIPLPINIQVLTGVGNYIETPGTKASIVFLIAGGGGGGSADTTAGGNRAAGGGGAGGNVRVFTRIHPLPPIPVSCGDGGLGGTGGDDGYQGEETSWNSGEFKVQGGTGGSGSNNISGQGVTYGGDPGGDSPLGDYLMFGGSGLPGIRVTSGLCHEGAGGSTFFHGLRMWSGAGDNHGVGGIGGKVTTGGASDDGQAGRPGAIVVIEFG